MEQVPDKGSRDLRFFFSIFFSFSAINEFCGLGKLTTLLGSNCKISQAVSTYASSQLDCPMNFCPVPCPSLSIMQENLDPVDFFAFHPLTNCWLFGESHYQLGRTAEQIHFQSGLSMIW